MNKYLDICVLPSLNQEEGETMNRPITRSEVKAAIKSLPHKKAQVPMGSQLNSTRHTKGAGTTPSETIPNNTKRGNPPSHFMKPTSS